jgi:protoporphyrinogen oxidase
MRGGPTTQLVVGAGLPGIAASLALAGRGDEVVLLDSAPEIGGLLRSYEVDGFFYDYGTHFANRTGIAELDEFLFGGFESEWIEFPALRAGNFWNGVLNEANDNPDLNTLGRNGHDRCLAELLTAPGWGGDKTPEDARQYLLAEYGPSLVDRFFDPVFKKFTGLTSHSLHYQANQLFNLRRFAVLDPSATLELKRSARFDAKVSFHHRDHFAGHRTCMYPQAGGIGKWIEQLGSKLEKAGVRVVAGMGIEHIEVSDGRVTKVCAGDLVVVPQNVFWAGAPTVFCKLVGIALEGKRPEFRATVLAGLECNRPFLSNCQYCTVFDPEFEAFRVTLYNNFRGGGARLGRHTTTVEFMIDPARIHSQDWSFLAEVELRRMGLIESGAEVIARHEKAIFNGFPVQTNEMVLGLARQVEAIKQFNNVHLIGRASGEGWFLDSLIKNAYYRASEIV